MTKSRIAVLEGLFPEQARCVISDSCPENFELLPAETRGTSPMVPRRRQEYRHGRCCARLALVGLGYPDCPVPLGADRAPLWPEGVVGSISHCGDTAAAAVAPRAEVGGIGLDIEKCEELDQPLLSMICRSEEIERLGPGDVRLLVGKLIFSAKESVSHASSRWCSVSSISRRSRCGWTWRQILLLRGRTPTISRRNSSGDCMAAWARLAGCS